MPTKTVQFLYDAQDNPIFAVIPFPLWKRLEVHFFDLLSDSSPQSFLSQSDGPIRDFNEFLQCWDFSYPYNPSVKCPCCGKETEDWRNDATRPFVLTNANIGGLLVFHCLSCGATIRQKHFRDHVAIEYSSLVH